jgi:hypothetical protein
VRAAPTGACGARRRVDAAREVQALVLRACVRGVGAMAPCVARGAATCEDKTSDTWGVRFFAVVVVLASFDDADAHKSARAMRK